MYSRYSLATSARTFATARFGVRSSKDDSRFPRPSSRSRTPGPVNPGDFVKRPPPPKPKVEPPPPYFHTPEQAKEVAKAADEAWPHLLPALREGIYELLGPGSLPTQIQSLALRHIMPNLPTDLEKNRRWLLAAETGSGKSVAWIMPVIQALKYTEVDANVLAGPLRAPRAIILAPTHELARQLTAFTKQLVHHAKLRVVCASVNRTKSKPMPLHKAFPGSSGPGEFEVAAGHQRGQERDIDILIGTPMKIMEMVRGRGWDRSTTIPAAEAAPAVDVPAKDEIKPRRGRDVFTLPPPKHVWTSHHAKPEITLARAEWVVVDEADVLFGGDFIQTTEMLLDDIAAARQVPSDAKSGYNLVLSTATLPTRLMSHLSSSPTYSGITTLATTAIHTLPRSIQTQYVNWSRSGNWMVDVERHIRTIIAQAQTSVAFDPDSNGSDNPVADPKILIFTNQTNKAQRLSEHLTAAGIANISLSDGEVRGRGSNKYLNTFLSPSAIGNPTDTPEVAKDTDPKVLISTPLLSRGLDFVSTLSHVFLVETPRNPIDFLHRAGRVGRMMRAPTRSNGEVSVEPERGTRNRGVVVIFKKEGESTNGWFIGQGKGKSHEKV